MRIAQRCVLLAALALVAAGCSKKQEVGPLPVAGETAKVGAKLAYEHHLSIELPEKQIAPRMAAVREACESARYGACNLLRLKQEGHCRVPQHCRNRRVRRASHQLRGHRRRFVIGGRKRKIFLHR